jgi:hypothetical protein
MQVRRHRSAGAHVRLGFRRSRLMKALGSPTCSAAELASRWWADRVRKVLNGLGISSSAALGQTSR